MISSQINLRKICSVLAMLLAISGVICGQSGRGNISGRVRDSSGASIPGAKITIVNSATNANYDLVSNDAGDFAVADVAVGSYSVRVERQGFGPAEVKDLTVNAGASVRADVTMQVGQSRQIVEVQAAALQVDSEDSQTNVTVNQTLVNTLPLVVAGTIRSPFDLASLTPEAKNTGSAEGFALAVARPTAIRLRSMAFPSTPRAPCKRIGLPPTRLR